MWSISALPILLTLISSPGALSFVPPSEGAAIASPNYGHPSNGSLPKTEHVKGEVFDRFITIWLENTDFATAITSPLLQKLTSEGILLTNYHGVTHPSEPNYIAAGGGDYFGMKDDAFYAIPSNVSTIVDLLEEKHISWASYQESMSGDGDTDFSEAIPNYLTGNGTRTFYVRKHNPLIIYDSVATVPKRAIRTRNFNDFAADFNYSAIPQWNFITPNLVDDGHDTDQTWIDAFLQFWLVPLLQDERFNNRRTLIVLTYDENEDHSSSDNNRVYTALLGGAIPRHLRNSTDDTFYTHYSLLSTVQRNWRLGCLGRNDADKTLANVFSFVAEATDYENVDVTDPPALNISGTTPGPLNPLFPAPWPAPNRNANCAGGGRVSLGGSGDDGED